MSAPTGPSQVYNAPAGVLEPNSAPYNSFNPNTVNPPLSGAPAAQTVPTAQTTSHVPPLAGQDGQVPLPPNTVTQQPTGLKRGRKPGMKLKRKRGRTKKGDHDESEEEFTLEGLETKSGRTVHKPQQFDPLAEAGGRKRTHHFRRDLQLCKVCQRGHSPESNLIVFCDGCNDPYHQLCHDPPIGRAFIEIAEAQWFCSSCQAKIVERPLEFGLSGAGLNLDEKRSYLLSLPTQHLVELLLLCENQYPDLRIYSPNTKAILAQRRHPRETPQMGQDPRASVVRAPIDDTTPLPGSGTQIPRETMSDAHYLVDDDLNMFSHVVYNFAQPYPQHPQQRPNELGVGNMVNGGLNGVHMAVGRGVI